MVVTIFETVNFANRGRKYGAIAIQVLFTFVSQPLDSLLSFAADHRAGRAQLLWEMDSQTVAPGTEKVNCRDYGELH